MTPEEMLNTLEKAGLRPRDEKMRAAILADASEQVWETCVDAMMTLGGEWYGAEPDLDREPVYHSDDIFHLDTECIENDGDYARLALRIQALSCPDLDHLTFHDDIDIQAEKAVLVIIEDGEEKQHKMRVDDDWLDPAFMDVMSAELEHAGSNKIIALIDNKYTGQDTLVICKTPEEITALEAATGVEFRSNYSKAIEGGPISQFIVSVLKLFSRQR